MAILNICTAPNTGWKAGFLLQRNHIYGCDERGWVVTAFQPGKNPGTVSVYRAKEDAVLGWVWYKTDEPLDSETGKAIQVAAAQRTSNRVERAPRIPVQKPERIEGPRMRSTGRYLPMAEMYIPGGSRFGDKYIAAQSRKATRK